MKRVYHSHDKWEEFAGGMWRIVHGEQTQRYVNAAAALMRVPEKFKVAMLRAVREWPVSCEVNLTARSMNRQAWLGHAGCCLAVNSPENCTRLGWHVLSQKEQDEANRVADEVIVIWEDAYNETLNAKALDRNDGC